MEKRLNKKIQDYIADFKNSIREKASELNMVNSEEENQLLQFIYDYHRLSINKEDLQKRKRVKNFVPIYDRCCAKRANNEQCTRRKKENFEYCGTHLKGTPHGIIDNSNEEQNNTQTIEVFAQEIHGIIYYLDNNENVYQAEDIISNKINPKIIAKYIKEDNNYIIPAFTL